MSVKVGIIGCGMITKVRHAPEYSENENVVIGGFYDFNKERAEQYAALYGGKAYDSYEDMLKDESIDAISVCSTNNTHAEITISALKAGKNVLCEKPMALTLEESNAMIEAAKLSGKKLMIGHNQRLLPTHRKAKEILESGQLGKPLFFQSNFKHSGPENWSINRSNSTWFFSKTQAHFGVFGDLGAHKIDIIRYLTGLNVSEIFATVMTVDKKYESGELIDIEDNAMCLLKMTNGMTGSMHVSWCNYGGEDNSTVIYCEKGVMKIFGDFPDDMVLEMKDGSKIKYHVGAIPTNMKQLKSGVIDEFIDSIISDRQPLVTGEDGHYTLATIIAGLESSKKGSWITVKY